MWEKNYFVQKRGVRGVISQKGRLEILRDVHQIEAFRTPDHVELTELMAIDFDLLQNCAREVKWARENKVKRENDNKNKSNWKVESWNIGFSFQNIRSAICALLEGKKAAEVEGGGGKALSIKSATHCGVCGSAEKQNLQRPRRKVAPSRVQARRRTCVRARFSPSCGKKLKGRRNFSANIPPIRLL